ncbi:MAG: hypothetical protein ACOVSW_02610 [Candidatus Kapaibacteriota bacterium]
MQRNVQIVGFPTTPGSAAYQKFKEEASMRLIAYFSIIIFCIASSAFAQQHSAGAPDKPSVHGMLFFGGVQSSAVYISHLPMFHTPHDYQILAEIELPEETRIAYQKSLKAKPKETVYTLVPEVFVLPEMFANPRPFKAELYCGHFERGGKPITEKFTVSIKRIIYQQKFDPSLLRPKTASYLVFGDALQQYAAHTITAKPDFDHILALANTPLDANALKTSPYTLCNLFEPNRPLKKRNFRTKNAVQGRKMLLKVDKTLYLEFDDLK